MDKILQMLQLIYYGKTVQLLSTEMHLENGYCIN